MSHHENFPRTGRRLKKRIQIDKERTIDFMGDELRVYSTPNMVSDMGKYCRDLIMDHAEGDEDSVGAHIRVDHLAPTLFGMWVDVTVTVTGVEGSRISFDVTYTTRLNKSDADNTYALSSTRKSRLAITQEGGPRQ
ncbi:MAG: hypothetical protein Ct9H300mP13_6060 [Gammaproteobacteria bacterium]|nr:MAG: hypothetical protein Ct9H300mP13_6060 [Gammaproteobacteria bacterium]